MNVSARNALYSARQQDTEDSTTNTEARGDSENCWAAGQISEVQPEIIEDQEECTENGDYSEEFVEETENDEVVTVFEETVHEDETENEAYAEIFAEETVHEDTDDETENVELGSRGSYDDGMRIHNEGEMSESAEDDLLFLERRPEQVHSEASSSSDEDEGEENDEEDDDNEEGSYLDSSDGNTDNEDQTEDDTSFALSIAHSQQEVSSFTSLDPNEITEMDGFVNSGTLLEEDVPFSTGAPQACVGDVPLEGSSNTEAIIAKIEKLPNNNISVPLVTKLTEDNVCKFDAAIVEKVNVENGHPLQAEQPVEHADGNLLPSSRSLDSQGVLETTLDEKNNPLSEVETVSSTDNIVSSRLLDPNTKDGRKSPALDDDVETKQESAAAATASHQMTVPNEESVSMMETNTALYHRPPESSTSNGDSVNSTKVENEAVVVENTSLPHLPRQLTNKDHEVISVDPNEVDQPNAKIEPLLKDDSNIPHQLRERLTDKAALMDSVRLKEVVEPNIAESEPSLKDEINSFPHHLSEPCLDKVALFDSMIDSKKATQGEEAVLRQMQFRDKDALKMDLDGQPDFYCSFSILFASQKAQGNTQT